MGAISMMPASNTFAFLPRCLADRLSNLYHQDTSAVTSFVVDDGEASVKLFTASSQVTLQAVWLVWQKLDYCSKTVVKAYVICVMPGRNCQVMDGLD
jgi:hypothetical protein